MYRYVIGMPVAPNVAEDKAESAFLQDALFWCPEMPGLGFFGFRRR